MAISKVKADWTSGNLRFKNRATGTAILTIDSDGDVEFGSGQYMQGTRFTVVGGPYVGSTGFPACLYVAPAACKVVSAYEFHQAPSTTNYITVVKQGGTLNSAQGTNCLVSTFNVSGDAAAYTPVSLDATNSTGLSYLAAGERIGALINVADANVKGVYINLTMEWL